MRWLLLQDEQSSVAMVKKHQIVEQAVEDYADTVHLLSQTSRGLVAQGHPDRYPPPPPQGVERLFKCSYRTGRLVFTSSYYII